MGEAQAPFRAKGVIFAALRHYIDRRVDGGFERALVELPEHRRAFFRDTLFVAGGTYDVIALAELMRALARMKGRDELGFARARARESAEHDLAGIYKPLLAQGSPSEMAKRLPRAFNRYFTPSRGDLVEVGPSHFEATLSQVPEPAREYFMGANEGFVGRALELAGASTVRFRWEPPVATAPMKGISTFKQTFRATWS